MRKKKSKPPIIFQALASLMALSASGPGLAAVTHGAKEVGSMQTYDSAACFYFRLKGVSEADPVKPGDSWFALERTQPGAKEALATLLLAKATDKTVTVVSQGAMKCGYASPANIQLD